jgi:hypothetical protein
MSLDCAHLVLVESAFSEYDLLMWKCSALLLLALGLSANAQASIALPEPSALPELGLCVLGLVFVVWYQRKSTKSK